MRDGKPKGFFYLDHRTVDGKCGIITDSFATPANLHDSVAISRALTAQESASTSMSVPLVSDAGYATALIVKGLEDRRILGVTGYRNPTPPKRSMMRKRAFLCDKDLDVYRCPGGQVLPYATTDRSGYRHYKSDPDGLPELSAPGLLHR